MSVSKFPHPSRVRVNLDGEGGELVLKDLLPSAGERELFAKHSYLTLSRLETLSNAGSNDYFSVDAPGGGTVARVDTPTIRLGVNRHYVAWRVALRDSAQWFEKLAGQTAAPRRESSLGLAPVPKGVRLSGPDPRGAEADLAKLSREREQLEKALSNARSQSERAQIEKRLKWVDEVAEATSALELSD